MTGDSTALKRDWTGQATKADSMSEDGEINTNDESVKAEGGNAVKISLVGYDHPFFLALAVVLALFSLLYCFSVNHEEAQRVYFTQRCEAFIEQTVSNHQQVMPAICGAREK